MGLPLSQALSIVTGTIGAIKSTQKSGKKIVSINEAASGQIADLQASYNEAQAALETSSSPAQRKRLAAELADTRARIEIVGEAEKEAVQKVKIERGQSVKGLAMVGVSVASGVSQWAVNRTAMLQGMSANRNLGAVSAQNISAKAQNTNYAIQHATNTVNTAVAFAANPVLGLLSLAGQVVGIANDIDNLKIQQKQFQYDIEHAVFNSQFMLNRVARINLPGGGL